MQVIVTFQLMLIFFDLIARVSHSQITPHQDSKSQAVSLHRAAANRIVDRARLEVTRGVHYDAEYRVIRYPGGDVPVDRGACTDVVIRAFRAVGKDLQALIHRKIVAHFRYPVSD